METAARPMPFRPELVDATPSGSPAPTSARALVVTATYALSEAGRKASLLAGGDGHTVQHLDVHVPANRLHLVTVNGRGRAQLKLRPRFDVHPRTAPRPDRRPAGVRPSARRRRPASRCGAEPPTRAGLPRRTHRHAGEARRGRAGPAVAVLATPPRRPTWSSFHLVALRARRKEHLMMTGLVCLPSRRTPPTGNGPRAHPMNGTPASRRSTRRRAHGAPAPKSAPSRPPVRTEAVAPTRSCYATRRVAAALTHWSFEQLAGIAGAPPKYLRTLPASIASERDQLRAAAATSRAASALRRPRRAVDRARDHLPEVRAGPPRRAGRPGARPHGPAPGVASAARLQGRRVRR
jgi:hypothetical protein